MMEVVIDTKGICLICFKEISPNLPGTSSCQSGGGGSTEEGPPNAFRHFQLLSHLLQINVNKILSLPQSQGSEIQLRDTQLKVLLCSQCSEMTHKFTKLCLELERVQLHLKAIIDQVQNAIKEADQDKERGHQFLWNRIKMVMTSPMELMQATVAQNLRKEIVEKC